MTQSKYNALVATREKIVKEMFKNIKDIKRILYIGAFPGRYQLINLFRTMYKNVKIELLEVWAPNYEHFKTNNVFDEVHLGSAVNVKEQFKGEEFDLVVWWHGPEHVKKPLSIKTIGNIETLSKYSLMGVPFGKRAQKATADGNLDEEHVSWFIPADFSRMGYTNVKTHGGLHKPSSGIVAYKKVK